MKRLLVAATMLTAATLSAQAGTIVLGGQNWTTTGVDNLTLQAVVPGGNQPQNIQCVICGDNQPQQSPTFGYTDYKNAGNISEGRFFSTNVPGGANPGQDTVGVGYGQAFLAAYLASVGDPNLAFSIGIDVNDTNQAQFLNSFFMLNLTTHTVLAAYTAGPTAIPSVNNGTGFPDYTLTGFNIQLGTDIHAGDQIIFFERMTNLSDGPDSFFLVPTPAAVPGPIVGAGLPGLVSACFGLWGFNRFRRRRAA